MFLFNLQMAFPAMKTETHQHFFFWHFESVAGSICEIKRQIILSDHFTSNNFTFLRNKLFQFVRLLLNSPDVYMHLYLQNTTIDHVMSIHIHCQGTLHPHSRNSNYRRPTLNNFEIQGQFKFHRVIYMWTDMHARQIRLRGHHIRKHHFLVQTYLEN